MVTTTQNGNGNGTQTAQLIPPTSPGEWGIGEIIKALSRPLPDSMLDTRKQGGKQIPYIAWHTANKILDKYAPGWNWSIQKIETTSDRIFVVGRLSIPTAEGLVYREATGTELLKEEYFDKEEGYRKIRELAYGDPTSNAESMAFRRAAARFGLGLYLYDKD
jgi:hypothetical protein